MKRILAILYAIIALRIAGGINSIPQIGNQETNADCKAHADEIYLDDHCSIRLLESSDSCIAEIRGSAGPEKSVTWRQYYRCSDNLFSEIFYYTLAVEDEIIIYATQGSVIIQNIFDKGRYYLEITEFQEPFTKMIDPIQSAAFSEDLSAVEIAYYSGEDYHLVRESVDLQKNGSL